MDAKHGPMDRAPPEAILIIRPGAIGDIVMASGLPVAMRAVWPGAAIHWLTRPAYAPLLRHHPCIDDVLVWPSLFAGVGSLHGQLKRLRAAGYDLVVDAQGLLKSTVVARVTGAPRRVGLYSREGGNRLMTSVVSRPPGGGVIGAEYRALARALGLDPDLTDPRIEPGLEGRQSAARFLREHQVRQPHVVLCPYTTRPQKHWPESRWGVLSGLIYRRFGLISVIVGGARDREAARRLAAGGPGRIAAAGALSLSAGAALIERAALVIGVDTGMTHMGAALRRPTIALFGSTRPYTRTPGALTQVLFRALPCAPCRRRPTCGGQFHCMTGLSVEEVVRSVEGILGRPGR